MSAGGAAVISLVRRTVDPFVGSPTRNRLALCGRVAIGLIFPLSRTARISLATGERRLGPGLRQAPSLEENACNAR